MNQELYICSQSPLTIDEFEVLEDIEIDPNTLNELLYELDDEENIQNTPYNNNLLEEVERDFEKSIKMVEEEFPVNGNWFLDNPEVDFSNIDWVNIVEEGCVPCNDWYEGIYMEEMFEIDYSLSHNVNVSEEIGYITLWQ